MQSNNRGFTIVELMIAMVIFAFAIILVMGTVIFIGKQYQKGTNQVKIEDANRTLHQNFSDAVKFTSSKVVVDGATASSMESGWNWICVGNNTYFTPTQSANSAVNKVGFNTLQEGLYVLYNDCADDRSRAVNILPKGAKVAHFDFSETNAVYTLRTNIILSDSDLLEEVTSPIFKLKCDASVAGKEFCAASEITSYSNKRTD